MTTKTKSALVAVMLGALAAQAGAQDSTHPLAATAFSNTQPIDLKMNNQPAQTVFSVIARLAGLKVTFDPAFDQVQAGALVSVSIHAPNVAAALDAAAAQTNAYWRPLGPDSFLVMPYEPGRDRAIRAAPQPPAVSSRMLVVGPPKVYDDLYLQNLLAGLQNQLASVNGVDQATLLSHIGQAQGFDLRQSSVALSASGPATPSTSTFSLAPGVPAFSYPPGYVFTPAGTLPTGVATATTPGTTTTTSSLIPTAPTPAAPTLTPPTTGQSSLGAYNESLQLSYEIMNTQLLLDGALSDRLQTDGKPKTTFTIGFPITIAPPNPADRNLQNATAEIEVSFCANSLQEPADIVTLLPRDRSYNVASLVDRSFLGSISGILGGVANIGGSFLWSHKTYYLVEQQETVALLDAAGKCGGASTPTAFKWQINPVLGKAFVRPGSSINFVQISVPQEVLNTLPSQKLGDACVTVRWLKGDKKGNYVGDQLDASGPTCYPVNYYTTTQSPQNVLVTDVGQGNVHVQVGGTFLPGTTVRIGNAFLNPSTITATHDALTFTVAAKALAGADRAYIVGRDNREAEVVEQESKLPTIRLHIDKVDIQPYSDSLSQVAINFTPPDDGIALSTDPAFYPWVVVIGDKVFGLSDARFLTQSATSMTLLAPTDLLRNSPTIQVRKLLWRDSFYRDYYAISQDNFTKSTPVVSKVNIISTQKGLQLGLSGSGLNGLQLVFPACSGCEAEPAGNSFATVTIPKPDPPKKLAAKPTTAKKGDQPPDSPAPIDPTDGLKQILVCRGAQNAPVPPSAAAQGGESLETAIQPISFQQCDKNYPVVAVDVPKIDAPTPKPALDKHDPLEFGTAQITIKGTLLDQVVDIEDGKQPLKFMLSTDTAPTLTINLPDTIAKVAGGHTLLVTFADKTTAAYEVTVKPAAN